MIAKADRIEQLIRYVSQENYRWIANAKYCILFWQYGICLWLYESMNLWHWYRLWKCWPLMMFLLLLFSLVRSFARFISLNLLMSFFSPFTAASILQYPSVHMFVWAAILLSIESNVLWMCLLKSKRYSWDSLWLNTAASSYRNYISLVNSSDALSILVGYCFMMPSSSRMLYVVLYMWIICAVYTYSLPPDQPKR